jgi:uncharacterized protein
MIKGAEVLFKAIECDNDIKVKTILESKSHRTTAMQYVQQFGCSPLSYAIESGSLKSAKIIIALGYGLNERVDLHPLELAIQRGYIEIVYAIINAGVDVNKRLAYGFTFLMRAIICRKLEIVQLLISSGADIYIKTEDGWTASSISSREGFHEISIYLANLENQ